MDNENQIISVRNLDIKIRLEEGILNPVRGIDFSVNKNETLGLVGESGCGKSLTCKAILGINGKKCMNSGEVNFYNEDKIHDLLKMKSGGEAIRKIRGKHISMIFQEPMSAFSPLFPIGGQISEVVRLHITKDKNMSREITLVAMKKVGIPNAEKRYRQYPHEFSGGMLQRALIAMALVCSPKLLIADEPTTALDVTIQAQILELMKKIQADTGMSILFITHDLGAVAKICDRVAVMYLGKIVEVASVKELFGNPLHPYTEGLLASVHKIGSGSSRLFSIEGTVPLAMNLENRCGFYERCPKRSEKCRLGGDPPLKEELDGHFAACWEAEQSVSGPVD